MSVLSAHSRDARENAVVCLDFGPLMLSSRHPEEQAGVDCYRASCIHDSHTRRHHRYPLLPTRDEYTRSKDNFNALCRYCIPPGVPCCDAAINLPACHSTLHYFIRTSSVQTDRPIRRHTSLSDHDIHSVITAPSSRRRRMGRVPRRGSIAIASAGPT
ncbi:hypothetical protein EV126DRAFT_424388 [Verticillium dahliae]|nr:hypothetical protein EV126DRAFT_436563 [Verticillium dahliae]KAH6699632.1 hypothetical protein EV126DRAFT_424388 [Verticillium dahliae]